MAPSEALAIDRLGVGDVDAGLRLSDAAGWNQTAEDWAFFIARGTAFGIRDGDAANALIATAAALPYGASVGWISMVLVDGRHRHRGHATRLVAACVDALRSAGRAAALDATPDGAAVYRRAGFAAGFAFERWQREAQGADALPGASVLDERRRDALLALDRVTSALDRSALFASFLDRPTTSAWLTGDASGFAILRAGRRARQLGPIVAADEEAAIALLDRALDAATGPVFIDVPSRWPAFAAALGERGFACQRRFVRMALGETGVLAANARVFAVAGPEFG
ncbi:MAG TPA: GNAT family N-acetyltransferase [Caldimonas sp.]|jgi:GNAT superfamily N-acetyltransferase|nr:GNAT family N-acetyltransferase [Caldimonas sp.]HEX4233531.1 GNAT family N-acetyltransferase [Caldimonas sp.]